MNAHVLTTTRSATSGAAAGTCPAARRVPVSLSESTWFFGQPSVSTQNVRDMAAQRYLSPLAGEQPARSVSPLSRRDRRGSARPEGATEFSDRRAGGSRGGASPPRRGDRWPTA